VGRRALPAKRDLSDLGAARVIQTIRGSIAYFDFDGVIGRALELYGEWAENEINFFRQFVPEGTTAIDAGANIGTHTVAFAEFVGRAGSVVAIEASPEIGLLLRKSVELNALRNVKVINAAVLGSRQAVQIPLLDPGVMSNVGGLKVDAAIKGGGHSITLDALEPLSRVSFIKLDVEGAEPVVLGGGKTLIARHRPAIACEVLDVNTGAVLLQMMTAKGYRPYFAAFAAYNAGNFRGNKENSFGHAHEASLVFIPPSRPIPKQTPGMYLRVLSGVEGLAKCFFEMPRYGDETPYDRIADRLVEERRNRERETAALRQQLAQELSSAEAARKAGREIEVEVEREAELRRHAEAEIKRLHDEVRRRDRDLEAASRLLKSKQSQIDLLTKFHDRQESD
jgi:FkbM family methyltransferase